MNQRAARCPGDVRVVSWNIRYGIDVAGAIGALRGDPALSGADIVVLQEMDADGVAAIADALGLHHAYASASVHRATGREFGNAILAREELHDVGVTDLPHWAFVRGEARRAVRATVAVDGERITAVSVHTEVPTLPLRKRRRQFDRVAGATPDAVRAIVGGDFNTVTSRGVAALRQSMADVGLTHVSYEAGVTFRRFGLAMAMDHVFARGYEVVDAGVGDAAGASDHRPLWVHLRRTHLIAER